MAARRLTSTGTYLQAVRDEDVSESPWERMLSLGVATVSPRIAEICGEFVVVERAPHRRPCASTLKLPPTQLRLDFERPRRLAVYGQRPRSIGNGPLTRKERAELQGMTAELRRAGVYRRRPKSYAACLPKPGPCPWVSCRHHMFLEVDEDTGAIKLNFPGLDVDELEQTCSLKVAAEGSGDGGYYGKGHTLERTGELVNLTLERTRQIVRDAVEKARARYRRRDARSDGD